MLTLKKVFREFVTDPRALGRPRWAGTGAQMHVNPVSPHLTSKLPYFTARTGYQSYTKKASELKMLGEKDMRGGKKKVNVGVEGI